VAGRAGRVRIAQDQAGVWSLWADDELLDRDHDPEHAPNDEIFWWAENVVFYERRVRISSWTKLSADDEPPEYLAVLDESV
jgi:hypothetical protein